MRYLTLQSTYASQTKSSAKKDLRIDPSSHNPADPGQFRFGVFEVGLIGRLMNEVEGFWSVMNAL